MLDFTKGPNPKEPKTTQKAKNRQVAFLNRHRIAVLMLTVALVIAAILLMRSDLPGLKEKNSPPAATITAVDSDGH